MLDTLSGVVSLLMGLIWYGGITIFLGGLIVAAIIGTVDFAMCALNLGYHGREKARLDYQRNQENIARLERELGMNGYRTPDEEDEAWIAQLLEFRRNRRGNARHYTGD